MGGASVLRPRGALVLRLRSAGERGEDKRAGEEDLLHRWGAKMARRITVVHWGECFKETRAFAPMHC
jgi:hypothetical protein